MWHRGWPIIDFLAVLLITTIVVFYRLVDWPAMIRRLGEILPRGHKVIIREVATDIDRAFSAFIHG